MIGAVAFIVEPNMERKTMVHHRKCAPGGVMGSVAERSESWNIKTAGGSLSSTKAFVRGSAQFKPSPAGFFATFLAGTRKVGPRSDRHLQIRRETGRFTLKSWKKVCFITKNAFGGSVTFLCSNKKVTKEIAREGR